jgi:hypothetical protein
MRCSRLPLVPGIALLVSLAVAAGVRAEDPSFEASARPVLKAMCFHCHGEEGRPKGGLDLRLVAGIRRGGDSGPAIEPGKKEEGLLWEKISSDEMPPGPKKLSAAQKAAIAAWIEAGAPTPPDEPESLPPGPSFSRSERDFWSFRPIKRPEAPAVRDGPKARTPVDAFLLAALEARGLGFSPEAGRPALIRRLTFDLTGLPPTPEEVAAFVADASPHAYEYIVDRLLASPAYGERWARHWMDAAGYADSDGGTSQDAVRPYSYKYRDWLIRAINADRRWDDMIREQLAGDETLKPPYRDLTPADLDRLTATGYLRLVPDATTDPAVDPVIARNEVVADTVKAVSTSLLGLTVGCAQCHTHRYDPISQEDYFRLRAIFEPALDTDEWRTPTARLVSLWTAAQRVEAIRVDGELARIEKIRIDELGVLVKAALDRELAAAPESLRPKLIEARDTPPEKRTEAQKGLIRDYPRVVVSVGNISLYDPKGTNAVQERAKKKSAEIRMDRPPEDFVHALTEVPGKVPRTRLHHRGDPRQPRQEIAPGELSVIAGRSPVAIPEKDPTLPTSGRRLAYARHLTDGTHPLVARVFVNRVWMHHFGRGLVATPGDFGSQGQRPSHPELLDRLAADFMAGGWSLKALHRTIVLSTAYRQSSVRTPALDAGDPENRLLGRMSIRRLEAEEIRDSILAVSGRLNPTMFGPPVPLALTRDGTVEPGVEKLDGNGHRSADASGLAGGQFRRSIYLQVRRTRPLAMLDMFDAPALTPNCDARNVSTVSTQSLMMLNDRSLLDAAEALSRRAKEESSDLRSRLARAWSLAYGTPPEPARLDSLVAFVDDQSRVLFLTATAAGRKPAFSTEERAIATLCQALLASNRFLYVD